jgi:hypothetical protein
MLAIIFADIKIFSCKKAENSSCEKYGFIIFPARGNVEFAVGTLQRHLQYKWRAP